MFNQRSKKLDSQSGQTLIETMVAIFILVMGIVAALALANYSLGATAHIRQETVAVGLAREGIEVVKNMRDINWLQGDLSTSCYDFLSSTHDKGYCYPGWRSTTYSLSDGTYYLAFSGSSWALNGTGSAYGMNLNTSSGTVFYNGSGIAATAGNSTFARRITISSDSFGPFGTNLGARMKVTSEVWWSEKKCTMVDDPPITYPCKVTLVTYLTNWRNF